MHCAVAFYGRTQASEPVHCGSSGRASIYNLALFLSVSIKVNPPYYIPLVELVPAAWTNPDVVRRTRALMADIGQAPVTLNKEVNGFILNRLQYALIMEAWRLVEVLYTILMVSSNYIN